ncbi:MAG: hypothetical protein RIQ47_1394 [Bacteroidota bacterium]
MSSRKFTNFCFIFSALLAFIFLITSCQKSDSDNGDLIAGTISLNVQVMHHTWGVPYTNIYLKKNTTVYPGEDTSVYDVRLSSDNDGKATFEGLHPGNYFVFSKGYDMIWGDTVIGYSPVAIATSAIENNTIDLTLIVSE